ncbi:MAG: DUF4834 family protein [Sphingobacteriaceae bacterium]|nr:MAG: DUF4834 family protein [Sphingobacteriaceae bacterium]
MMLLLSMFILICKNHKQTFLPLNFYICTTTFFKIMLLIRFLIILICALYMLRMLGRLLLPALFRGMMNKAQAQSNTQSTQNRPERHSKEGTIKVDYIPPNVYKSAVPASEGEFVKYEEVKS